MLYGDEKFDEEHPHHTIEKLSENFEMFGYKFVPLVTRQISLLCGLEILFLRPDPPGGALRSGDIDNRIKTLFDALRLPRSKQELKDYPDPEEDEKPFFCLLEDDCLITKIAVETDMLLEQLDEESDGSEEENDNIEKKSDNNDVRLIITARLRPYEFHFRNMKFT